MKKIKIFGIGNETEFNHYTIEKTKQAHQILAKLLMGIFNIDWGLVNENGRKSKKIDITKNKDFHQNLGSIRTKKEKNKARADVYYGDTKMFMVIHGPVDQRKKFNEKLEKISKIIKPKQ